MELIASLKQQLERLCRDASDNPNWMLQQLSQGLRERYGATGVAFARQRRADGCWMLLGCCALDGQLTLKLSEDFTPTPEHPVSEVKTLPTEAWFAADMFGQWAHAELDALFGLCRSAFLVPWLVDQPSDWHILILSPIHAPTAPDRNLSVIANLLATTLLRSLDAVRLEKANAWIERELDEIAHLQKLLQPDELGSIRGVDIAVSSLTYHYAGGDYFDIPCLTHLVDDAEKVEGADNWGAIIADVSGHGPSAAVEAAMLDAIMRTYPGPVGEGPAHVMGYLNRYLFTRKPRASFVSAFVCGYDPVSRILRYVCGGHPPAILKAAGDKDCQELKAPPGIPLRVDPDYVWTAGQRAMVAGDVLVLYTDGVTESRSPDRRELGVAGLMDIICGAEGSAEDILGQIRQGIHRFTQQAQIQDDQTILVFKLLR